MKHHVFVLFIVLGLSAPSALAGPPPEIQAEAQNSFIFTFDASVAISDIPAMAASLTAAYHGTLRHVFTHAITGFSATMSRTDAEALINDNPEVSGLVNNGVARVPNTGAEGGAQGGIKGKPPADDDEQVQSWGVAAVGGACNATYNEEPDSTSLCPLTDIGINNITRHVWIIDTGIDDYYSDNELNIGEGENYVTKGKDTTDDVNGHGTHIAGIIAAIDNDTGVLGIAAGATVHPVRVLHKNLWGFVDDIIAGVDYVAGRVGDYPNDIHVVNMSLTVERDIQEDAANMLDAAVYTLADSGVNFAVCAGNDADDVSLYSPAHLASTHNNIHTIASINEDGDLASDSNYGPEISFVAPGVTIESLKPGGGTWFWSGCSMATAHVSGILLFQQPPNEQSSNTGYPLAGF
jgi:subtilisin family serine protease